ncbi:nucleotidyltransferase domain-containing protein [Niabella sp. W65]|nr:nucleotidyltransferase domain-containing protein [Niabella sp. W65]MCH7362874.1 nucleotidyltransferase domain-containing protein [Niabella sp. W65]ULT38823.1 nucleotidyltransferase domain-containing protein [Niabella sp. I65]
MKDIQLKLKEIATEKKVSLLYACETGSRAWGFLPRIATMMYDSSTGTRPGGICL